MIKKVTLAPGEAKPAEFQFRPMEARVYQVSVDGLSGSFSVIEAPPPPALELIEAYFDNGSPMTKKPGDTFTVTLKIKNNLTKDWSPNNILYGFGVSPDPGSPETWSPIVWGRKPFTDEVWPEACGRYGKWPIPAWPIILAGTTKTFTTTYGLCPGAAGGIYDGIIRMDDDKAVQYVMHPAILTVSGGPIQPLPLPSGIYVCSYLIPQRHPVICGQEFATRDELDQHMATHDHLFPARPLPNVDVTEGKLTKVIPGYQAKYSVTTTIFNGTDITYHSGDGCRLIANVRRPGDLVSYGSYPLLGGVTVPQGSTTYSWNFLGDSHWGEEPIVLPNPLNYILEISLSLYVAKKQVGFIIKRFPETIALS